MNMEYEVRKGYAVSAGMKKIWKVQLDLARKLLETCDKYGLPITASGGTTLGAVREHGFIPWDDDMDFQMLREDYDKLVRIAPNEFKHPYFFQCAENERNYVRGHAQLRMDGTSAILEQDIFQNFHQGIFIDIFPLDNVPASEEDVSVLKNLSEKMMKRMRAMSYPYVQILGHLFPHCWDGIKLLKAKLFSDLRKEYAKYENLFRATKDQPAGEVAMMTVTWDLFEKTRVKKSVMHDVVKVPFEDMMIPIPANYDEVLRRQYGDYTTPVKTPSYHGAFIALDAERSYKDFLRTERKVRMRKYRDGLLRALHLK